MRPIKKLTLISLFMMMGALFLMKLKYDNLVTLKEGKEITVNIVDVPRLCGEGGRTSKPYFRFVYNGQTHRKDFNGKHCDEVRPKKTINLITDDEHSVFLFRDEDVTEDIAAFGGLSVIFAVCAAISQFKKEKIEMRQQTNYKKVKKPLEPKNGRYGNKI